MTDLHLPTYTDLLLPTLQAVDDIGGSGHYKEIDEATIGRASITDHQLSVVYAPDSTQSGPKVLHRIAWARSILKRIGALESVSHGVWGITDPGRSYLEMDADEATKALAATAQQSYAGVEPGDDVLQDMETRAAEDPIQIKVRDLIALWGANRRWSSVNDRISKILGARGLTTEPEFTTGGLDLEVAIVRASDADSKPGETKGPSPNLVTLTVGNLPSASGGVLSVNPNDELLTAQSHMRANDYSQLAVMEGKYALKGAVSWESIARARLTKPSAKLIDCIIKPPTTDLATPLLDVVPNIVSAGFVFVRTKHNEVSGIVTTADLSEQFSSLARPFLLVGEAEQWLRAAIDSRFSPDELVDFLDPADGDREVEAAHSLSLGEIQRLLDTPEAWDRLEWPADRNVFISSLDRVRTIRNGIMHFSPDPLDDTELRVLMTFSVWLRELVPGR